MATLRINLPCSVSRWHRHDTLRTYSNPNQSNPPRPFYSLQIHKTTAFLANLNPLPIRSPPYEWWHDGGALAGVPDIPRQLLRWFRKSIGIPSSADVGAIASLLSKLVSATEKAQKIKITHAVISTPDLVALYDEDIADAAEHVGITLLQDAWFERQPRHIYAAFVGYGLNDAYHPTDSIISQSTESAPNTTGEEAPKTRNVLSVHLTHSALSIEAAIKWTNRTCGLD